METVRPSGSPSRPVFSGLCFQLQARLALMVTVGTSEVDLGEQRGPRGAVLVPAMQVPAGWSLPAAGGLWGCASLGQPRPRTAEAEIWGLNPALKSVGAL